MTVDCPDGFERTPRAERQRNSRYQATLGQTTADLETEMGRLSPDGWRVSTGSGGSHTKTNGLPKHSANPDDPSVVLRWTKSGEQYAVACDAYRRLRDNVRTVYLWMHETRMRSQRPVITGEDEFAAARLPPGDDATAMGPGANTRPAHAVLDVAPDADPETVRAAHREKVKEAHPDRGGSEAELRRVNEAREEMLQ